MTSAGPLADELRQLGRRAGLEAVGICDSRPFSEARAAIEARKSSGESAGMQFTFRRPERSTDPAVTMPTARALFVGARSYLRQAEAAPDAEPTARVARYSWIDHYALLRTALGQVAARLESDGWKARVLVDDNALVDRAAAVRAGLGWYGKNANVLLPGRGSWFVLGSVLTDAPIAPLRPAPLVADGCGTCRRCMVDCPTNAIVAPGQVDGRRCLAWLLQAPGPFPVQFRRSLGDRLYGCDECQERCPVNRRATTDVVAPLPEEGAQTAIGVLRILSAPDDELAALVGRWYIPGRDLRYVRRNALVVLGNSGRGGAEVEAALRRYLSAPDPLLQAHAVWAAKELCRSDLLFLAASDDPMVAEELARAGP